jgi:hypothetical protein
MAITRINNNQITDSIEGNVYYGVNAAAKLQNYSITSQKIANSLTYGSDLTVAGNLTVQGNVTAIDTINLVIEDPLILLAKDQTGSPTLDIGFIGERGSSINIAYIWDESAGEFATVFTNDAITNTVVTIDSYASLHVANITASNANITGNVTFSGNIVGNLSVTGNVSGGNLTTVGIISAASTVGGVITGSSVSVTGAQSAASTVGGVITGTSTSVTGDVTGGNVLTGGLISATGNISGNFFIGNGSQLTGIDATQISSGNSNIKISTANGNAVVNISGTSNVVVFTTTGMSVTSTVTAASVVGGIITGTSTSVSGTTTAASVVGGEITGSSTSVTGTTTAASVVGGVITGSSTSVTGTQTAASTVGGVITGSSTSVTGTTTAASVVGGVITGSSTSVTGAQSAASTVGGVITGSSVSVTGNVTGDNFFGTNTSVTGTTTAASVVGGVITGSSVSVTGNVTGDNFFGTNTSVTGTQTAASTVGGVITGTSSSVTGTQTAASTVGGVITGTSSSVTGTQTAASTVGGVITGSSVSVSGNVTGGNILAGSGQISTSGNVNAGAVNTNSLVGTTITISGTSAAFSLTGNVDLGSRFINNLGTPVADADAATKAYVDEVAQGLDIKASVVYATTTALPAYTYNNGASGVGATITANANGALSIDSNAPTVGERVLIKNETAGNQPYNGIYVVTVAGSGAAAFVLTRSTDFDNGSPSGEIPGAFTFVEAGTINADSGYVCTTNAPVTVGTTNIVWAQFSGGGSFTANTAAGLSLIGTQFNALVDNVTTAFISGNIAVKAGAQLTTPDIGAATGTSLSVTGTVTAASVVGGEITGSSTSVTGTTTAASVVGGVITGSSVSVTGNVSGTNFFGTNTSVTGTQTAASTVGGVITGTSTSVTGTQTAASTVGGVITGSSTSVTGTQTAASTVGGVITGSSTSVTGTTTAASVVGGVITGSSVSVTGNVTGDNFFGTNTSVTGTTTAATGTFSGNLSAANLNTVGNVTGTGGFFTGNVTAANFIGNVVGNISGNVDAGGANTNIQFNDADILAGSAAFTFDKTSNLVTVSGNLSAGNVNTNQLSLSGNVISALNVTGNITGGNLITAGNVYAPAIVNNGTYNTKIELGAASGIIAVTTDGNSTQFTPSGQINLSGVSTIAGGTFTGSGFTAGASQTDLFQNRGGNVTVQVGTGGSIANTWTFAQSGEFLAPGNISATGNVTGGNIITNGQASLGNIRVSGDTITGTNGQVLINSAGADVNFIVSGDTIANLLVVDAGSDTVLIGTGTPTTNAALKIGTTNSILIPVGNTAQRPGTAVTGMVRFNTSLDVLEFYDSNSWTPASSEFTVITADEFNGDGSTVSFTLSVDSTTAGTVVAINGVVQIPTTAYSVSGTTLTFTEAPETNDVIDARIFTTTTTVTGISNAGLTAVVETLSTADVEITGNLSPVANVTYDLGSATSRWKDLYLSGSSLYLGNVIMKTATGNTIAFFQPDGTTPATIAASSVDTTQIASGTSSVAVVASGGNIRANIAGTTVQTISAGLVAITGDLSVTGNATLSGNILGDRVQNGTTSLDIQTPNGNANITVGGTSNVAVFSTTGAFITGLVSVTGAVTAASVVGGVITGTSTSVSGTTTAASVVGGVITGSSVSVTGTTTAASVVGGVITGTSTSVSGTTTAASVVGGVITGSSVSVTGTINGTTLTGTSLTVSTGSITGGNIINANGNGIGNIGSSTVYFNTVFAKATSAQYADLAEMYEADQIIEPGTVVCFGGAKEVTMCAEDACRRVAGVVSTNPSYLMNSGQRGEYVVAVALQGRVPVRVTGPVQKGDMMVATSNGRARAEANPQVGAVIGKALADFDGQDGVIEVVVGRV